MINQILLRGAKVFLHWSVNAIKNKNKQPTINVKERKKRIKTKPKKNICCLNK